MRHLVVSAVIAGLDFTQLESDVCRICSVSGLSIFWKCLIGRNEQSGLPVLSCFDIDTCI